MTDTKMQLNEVLAQADRLAGTLNDEQMNWRPHTRAWSVGECLGHLTITAERFREGIAEAIAESRTKGRTYDGPARPSLPGRLFLKMMEPPVRFARMKTPAAFVPQPDRPAGIILDEFRAAHKELPRELPEYLKWDQNRTRVRSPFASQVRYSLGLALQLIPAHCRRHLWQAGEVTQNDEFPKM